MSQYFPKAYKSFAGNIKVKVDLSDYITKLTGAISSKI